MKLNIKKIAPLLVAGAIVLGGCQSVHGQAINKNNIDSDNDTTIEFNIDDENYVSSDDWEEIFSDNIEGSIYGVSKNLILDEDEAASYLHGLTGSDITFQDCEDFYINRFESRDDRVGTLNTIDTLYVDHNEVCRVSSTLEADSLVDDEYNYIPVVDLLEQGVDIEDIDLDDTQTRTDIDSRIFENSNVTKDMKIFIMKLKNMMKIQNIQLQEILLQVLTEMLLEKNTTISVMMNYYQDIQVIII